MEMINATQTKIINGKSCTVIQFPAGLGIKMLTRLTKLIGPSLSKFGAGIGSETSIDDMVKSFMDLDISTEKLFGALSDAIMDLSGRMDEDAVYSLIIDLLSSSKVNNQEANTNFDLIFMGDYQTLFKLLVYVIEVNYKSFLGDGVNSTNQAAPQMNNQAT